ncbi:MAG: glycan-binding surface protein [Mangrovibacterium sp.]
MKALLLDVIFIIAVIGSGICITSCEDDKDEINEVTAISRITTVTDRETAITTANLAQFIIVQGQELNQVTAIKVNDVNVDMEEAYITSNEICFSIPRVVPVEVNNLVTLITPEKEVTHPLEVFVPALRVDGMYNEFAPAGGTMKIIGDFFDLYKIDVANGKVYFGSEQLSVTEASPISISFTLPANAAAGTKIKVQGAVGPQVEVPGKYKETGYQLYNFNPFQGWGGASFISSDPVPGPVEGTQYCRFKIAKADAPDWAWSATVALVQKGGCYYPDDIKANPSAWQFKFEVCTMIPLTKRVINFYFANIQYTWSPFNPVAFDTHGEWRTISIDLNVAWKGSVPNGDVLQVMGNGLAEDTDICFDNLRIVPKD